MKPEHQAETFAEVVDRLGLREEIATQAVKARLAADHPRNIAYP